MGDSEDYPLIDFDQHYYEPPETFSDYIEPRFRDVAIRVVPDRLEDAGPGGRHWAYKGRKNEYARGMIDEALRPASTFEFYASGHPQFSSKSEIYATSRIDIQPETRHRGPRLAVMADQGVEACLMLPTNGACLEHAPVFLDDDVTAVGANFRAFNRWLEDEWGFGSDGRIYAAAYISFIDRDWAAAEVERVAEAGAKFLVALPGPAYGRSPADPYFDKVWSAVQDAGLVFVYHIGFSSMMNTYSSEWSETATNVASMSAFQHYSGYGERTIADTIAALTLHNLFGRFPRLQVMTVELGSRWVAPLLSEMDSCARKAPNGDWLGGRVEDLPSEVFKHHVTVAPYPEDDVRSLIDLIGIERVVFGSDWPHPEGLASPKDYLEHLSDCDEYEQRQIMRENARRILTATT